jgi:sec-independent protein translocase protein TatB
MFGLGWSELVLIGIVALIVVGPKDLPGLFRSVGQFTGKARGMAREFSKAMEDAARDSGIKDVEKTIRAAANPAKFGTDALRNSAMSAIKPGGETEKLSKERDEMRARIEEATAKAATDRKAREAAAAAKKEAAATPEPEARPAPRKRAPAKKAAAKPATARAKPAPKTPKADQ